jgi:hypothetical protein
MMIASLHKKYKLVVWLACGCFLLPLVPLTTHAQTVPEPTILDNWRSDLNQRLDEEMQRLALPGSFHDFSGPAAQPEEKQASQTYKFSGWVDRRNRRWPVVVREILESQGLPANLAGVAEVESGFDPTALSPKGAAGLWQLMPGTARQFGLIVNASRDDRFDVFKSTVAAGTYIRQLYHQFGDWSLAFAAYDAGPSRVWQEIHHLNTRDFSTLSRNLPLPRETLSYVPKTLAATGFGLAGQALESEHERPSNGSGKAVNDAFATSHYRGEVVFAATTPE